MAQSSGVTCVIELGKLPLLPGVVELAKAGNRTRASASNRSFAAAHTRIERGCDALHVEIAFDAQTSGGLLLAVSEENAAALVEHARSLGAAATAVVGRVAERGDTSLVLAP